MADEVKPSVGETPKPEDVQAELARTREELESVRGKVKKYSDEAAAARVARKTEYEEKITELEAKLKGKDDDGAPTPKPNDAEAAKLRAEIADLRKKDEERDKREKEREQKSRERAHRSVVTELVARHKLENPDDAIELLMRRTKLADDESTLLYTAKDKDTNRDQDLALTDDTFTPDTKLLGVTFWPARGQPGAGGKQPPPVSGGGAVDEARALEDPAYFRKHEKELVAQRRARQSGGA